jgi:hypothetical protein
MIKTIEINEEMGNVTAIDVLLGLGYKLQGVIDFYWNKDGYSFKTTKGMHDKHYFYKDGGYYLFLDWTYFNSYIYEVKLKKLS